MSESTRKEKSFPLAFKIVKLCRSCKEDQHEYVLGKQLLRCGTSVGAMVQEAKGSERSADFQHKLGIAQKECDESIYWLELLYGTS